MKDIEIIDKFVDDREFRNYVISFLIKEGYKILDIDDPRISDNIKNNDNDFIVIKDNIIYTVQTFLNKDISNKELDETVKDMSKEKTKNAIIVTNQFIDENIINSAKKENIIIIDRKQLQKLSNN